MKPMFRFVPDGTRIRFMNGRFAGLIVSAVLSSASIILFFYPGLNLGLDFRGGVVLQIETPQKANFAALRAALAQAGLSDAGLQSFGAGAAADHGVLISLESRQNAAQTQTAITEVEAALKTAAPGATILSTQAIGASVSNQLFAQGLEALGLSFVMILAYIWFRFEWQFAVGAVTTLLLDTTKTIGFRIPFDLVTIAAILTVIGYSTNDKVVVYDRVRENLRKYKSMPLRELIDLSINETLNRTLGTSGTVFLAALPLALFGGSALAGFAWIMLFGIVVGTSSSIFIAAPILLFLSRHLRRSAAALKK
jgi:preprotein translocase subunit SecD/preprotein translocase subunit SecF